MPALAFVHTAPSHGREDFEIWTRADVQQGLRKHNIDPKIPSTIDDDSIYTKKPRLRRQARHHREGEKGDANEAVIKALIEADALVARGRLKHQYPHPGARRSRSSSATRRNGSSPWTSRSSLTARPAASRATLRETAFAAISKTEWVPASGENRIRGMVENKQDWVMSRQRAWGVPITVFVHRETKELLQDKRCR